MELALSVWWNSLLGSSFSVSKSSSGWNEETGDVTNQSIEDILVILCSFLCSVRGRLNPMGCVPWVPYGWLSVGCGQWETFARDQRVSGRSQGVGPHPPPALGPLLATLDFPQLHLLSELLHGSSSWAWSPCYAISSSCPFRPGAVTVPPMLDSKALHIDFGSCDPSPPL